jgi:carbonic anhydrase
MGILEIICERQRALSEDHHDLPEHRPEMLYFGCVDARLDPICDIGIPKGKALIHRNIAALIPPASEARPSIGAVLEFFLNHIPKPASGPKHIVVAAHTDCGGLKACCALHQHEGSALGGYLEGLAAARHEVMKEAQTRQWDQQQILHALEHASVRQSVKNLLTYEVVRQALSSGNVVIHGWLMDTATRHIAVMDPESGDFRPMTAMPQRGN